MTTLDEIAADVKAIRRDLSKCHGPVCALGCELYQGALADLELVRADRSMVQSHRDAALARVKALEDAVRAVRQTDLWYPQQRREFTASAKSLDALYALLDKEA